MVLWYNMLDVVAMNAYTLFIVVHTEYMNGVNHKQRLFLKELLKELVKEHAAHGMASETAGAQKAR